MKHFQNSAKSTSSFNDTLAIFSMKKVDLITFCPTRMSYLLDSCLKATELFIPLCDVFTTIGIKKDETDSFLASKQKFIMHILAGLQPVFNKYLLKAVDKDEQIIINIFGLNKVADHVSQEFECTELKSFVEGLPVDDKSNVICSINANNDKHNIELNYNHRPSRLINLSKSEILTQLAGTLKKTILFNVIENINSLKRILLLNFHQHLN